MSINKEGRQPTTHAPMLLWVITVLSVGVGCGKLAGLNKLKIPSVDLQAPAFQPNSQPIISMQKTFDLLKNGHAAQQQDALDEIAGWLNDGIIDGKDDRSTNALLDFIASGAPVALRAQAVGMLMTSSDDKKRGGLAQKGLSKQLADSKKAGNTAQAMVEFVGGSRKRESDRQNTYNLCLVSHAGRQLLAKKLFGSQKGAAQAIELFVVKQKKLSDKMQDEMIKALLLLVKNPNWRPDADYIHKLIEYTLKTRMEFDRYMQLAFNLSHSSNAKIREILIDNAFNDKDELHKHAKQVNKVLNTTAPNSLAAETIVMMAYRLQNLTLIGEMLLDKDVRQRVDKSGIALAQPLVTRVEELLDEMEDSFSVWYRPPHGGARAVFMVDNDPDRSAQAEAQLKKYAFYLGLEEIKSAVTEKLRELTTPPPAVPMPAHPLPALGDLVPNPDIFNPVGRDDHRIEWRQLKFGNIEMILANLSNTQLIQHLQNQAAYIRQGRAIGEAPHGWPLPL